MNINTQNDSSLKELIEKYGGIALDKQNDLYDVIGENNWNVDLTMGKISFGENLVFPIQVLGTYSHSSGTWLWAWANTQSNIPDNLLKQSLQLKKYGTDNGIELLQNSTFTIEVNDIHAIGIIASGMFLSSGYYLADYGQGIMCVTIKSEVIDKIRQDDHLRILTVFPNLISSFEMNHRKALVNYLTAREYEIIDDQNKLTGTKNGKIITAEFDELSRLTGLNG